MCVCCTDLFSFFPLAFVLVNDLFSGFSLFFGNAYAFVFVAVCLFLLYVIVFYVYCRVLPDVLSLMLYFMYPHWGLGNKPLDLT